MFDEILNWVKGIVGDTAGGVGEAAQDLGAGGVGDTAQAAGEQFGEQGEQVQDALADPAAAAGEELGGVQDAAGEAAQDPMGAAGEAAQDRLTGEG